MGMRDPQVTEQSYVMFNMFTFMPHIRVDFNVNTEQ